MTWKRPLHGLLVAMASFGVSVAQAQSLKAQYKPAWGTATQNQIVPVIDIVNAGTSAVTMSTVTVRYWYTEDGTQPQTYWCDYAPRGCSVVTARFVTPAQALPTADRYLELGFTSAAGSLAAGQSFGAINSRFTKTDWSSYNQSNDYSYDGTRTALADWNRVTIYVSGALVWGVEPTASSSSTDTTPPTAPTNLAASSVTSSTVALTWTAASDAVGVTGYDVYQGTTRVDSVTATSDTVAGLSASTAYSFTVRAKDAAGNVSAASAALAVTTLAASTTVRHEAPYPAADKSVCGSWALVDNVCCAQYCSNSTTSENCDACGGPGSALCTPVNSKACVSGEWPEVHSLGTPDTWHYSRSTHYGVTYAGACGFGMYGICSTAYKNSPQCAAFCTAYPNLCRDPSGISLRGNIAAPSGNYYTQFWSSLPGDRDNYLSCGECFEMVRTKKDGTDYQPGETGYAPSIVLTVADSCPCSANSKWCCGSGRDHCGEVSDYKYGCQLPPAPPVPPANHDPLPNESVHLDLSDIAMARLQTGDANGSLVDGVIPTRYRRVPCPVVGNAYVWLRSGAGPYWFALSIVNTSGLGSVVKVEAQMSSGQWVELHRDSNYTSARPQERYGVWVVPTGAGPFGLPLSLRITDASGKAIVGNGVIKAWSPADTSLLDTYYIDLGVQF